MDEAQALSVRDGLARFMFDRQVASYDADPEEADRAWADPQVRQFWADEALAVILWLART